jgi:2-keto-4-pentenoate hydratase
VWVLEQTDARGWSAHAAAIAQSFVAARLSGQPLGGFPGRMPADLAAAYACQDAAIELWPDTIAGWKVGLIGQPQATVFQQDRLAGPIFRRALRSASVGAPPTPFPVYRGGFAAVEAEYLLLLGSDAPPGKLQWSLEEAMGVVRAVHVGIETAGSPLETINDLGPCAIVADFGNNAGLIVGPELPRWREDPVAEWRCDTFVDGAPVGGGHGAVPPGGPFESLRFLLALGARRSRPLKAGDWISTGAITGVHEIAAGQTARISFRGVGELFCRAEPFIAQQTADAGAVSSW